MNALPDNWQEIAWERLPLDIRQRAVARLKAVLKPELLDAIRDRAREKGLGKWMPAGWHFDQGMAIRNVLRSNHGTDLHTEPVRDAELPALPELYGAAHEGNWDDFYVPCLEAAAGARPVQ